MPDLHISNITLNSYRGTPPEITLAMFFLARAKVLRVLRLNTHLIRKDQWYDYQSRQVLRNGSASKNAKLHIGRAYAKQLEVIVSNPYMTCQRLIPFQKLRGLQYLNLGIVIFEFEPCNIYGICCIEPFLFSCLNTNTSFG